MQAVFENQSGSELYHNFLENVGWTVNLNDHVGFVGGLDPKVTGQYAPYWANYGTVPPLKLI
jgi:hypothetical protein